MMRFVRRTSSPSLMAVSSPRSTTPTLFSSRFMARPKTSPGKFQELPVHDLLDTVDPGDPVTDGDDGTDLFDFDGLFERPRFRT